jgi:hypothetical protein
LNRILRDWGSMVPACDDPARLCRLRNPDALAPRPDVDPAPHSRMKAARIAVGSGFCEGERKAVVRIERFGME